MIVSTTNQTMSTERTERGGAFIVDRSSKNCLLVHQKRSNLWGIPKGRKDFVEEKFHDCMKREVMEEVGLDLETIKYDQLGVISVYSKTKIFVLRLKEPGLPKFVPPLENGEENHEVDKIEWVPIDEVQQRDTNSITRRVLDRYRTSYATKNKQKTLNMNEQIDIVLSLPVKQDLSFSD